MQAAKGLAASPFQTVLSVELLSTTHALDERSDRIVHQLDEDPQNASIVIIGIDHVEAGTILPTTHPHQSNLVKHELPVLFTAWCAELQSELLLVVFALDAVHLGKAADAEFFLTEDIVEG